MSSSLVFDTCSTAASCCARLEDLAIEMLAHGLSVRDIEIHFRDENGRLLYRWRPGERLRKDYAILRGAVGRRQPIIMCARSCAPTGYEEALLPQLT
jgi:hypothetical protein